MKTLTPPANAFGLFTRSEAYRCGLTSWSLSRPPWRHVMHRVYADSEAPIDHMAFCRGLLMSREFTATTPVFAGPTAAWLAGLRQFNPAHVHVLVARREQFGPLQRIRVHTSKNPFDDETYTTDSQLLATTKLRTAWDTACWLPPEDSIEYVDAMCAAGWFTPRQLRAYAAQRPSVRGSVRARKVVALATPNSASPAVSRLRVLLQATQLPAPRFNYQFPHDPNMLLSFAWPKAKVALQPDHEPDTMAAVTADDDRLKRLLDAGWIVIHATYRHLYGDAFAALERQIRLALH